MKPTKNIITRNFCQETLLRSTRPDAMVLYLHILGIVVGIPMAILLFFGCLDAINDVTKWNAFWDVVWILMLIFVEIWLLYPLYHLIYLFVKGAIDRRKIQNGAFSLYQDEVEYLVKDEPAGRRRTVDVIYFRKFGRCPVGRTEWELTERGDMFYLFVIDGKNPKPLYLFNAKRYEPKNGDFLIRR